MPTASVTSKGQVTIPAAVRESMHVGTGDRVEFVEITPGRYEVIAATLPVTALKGMFAKPATPVTVAQMNEAIAGSGATKK